MDEEVNKITLDVMANKIKSQERHIKSLSEEVMILKSERLPNTIRLLRLYGMVIVSFFDELQTSKDVEKALIDKKFSGNFAKMVSEEVFFLSGASLSDTEREAVLRAFNHGQYRWAEKQKG